MWDNAENKLREVLDDIGIPYVEKVGEAAFYGPKLDVQVKPAVGNEYTCDGKHPHVPCMHAEKESGKSICLG